MVPAGLYAYRQSQSFRSSAAFSAARAWTRYLDPAKRPLSPSPLNLLFSIVPLSIEPDRFDSFSHQFGPIFLLFLPALFFERTPRRVWALVILGYLFLTLCMTQRQSMRFLLIALGPSVGGSRLPCQRMVPAKNAGDSLPSGCPDPGAWALRPSLAAVRARHGLSVLLRLESVSDFLTRREPTYTVGRWAASNLPAAARLIGQDHRGFYIPRDYTMELAHRRRTGLGKRGEPAREIVASLIQSGFTHVMLCPPISNDLSVEFDPTLGRLLQSWTAVRQPLYRDELSDADGVVRRYSIYELANRVAPDDGILRSKRSRPSRPEPPCDDRPGTDNRRAQGTGAQGPAS